MIDALNLLADITLDGATVTARVDVVTTSRYTAEILSATYRGRDVTAEARAQLDPMAVLRAEVERCARSLYGLPRTAEVQP